VSSSVGSAGFYADFGALTELKKNVKSDDPQALRTVARQFESLFTEMVLKSMREAKLGQGLGESDETDFYQDMYDQQLAVQMSQGKGLGLADMLVQQLTRGRANGGATGAAAAGAGASATGGSKAVGGAAHAGAARAQRISFVQMLEPYANSAGAQLGVSADSLIAQAALETNWGQRVPSTVNGRSSNNLFGVKAGASFSGEVASAPTTEYVGGSAVAGVQTFRAYGSVQEGVNDYVALMRGHASYQRALGTGTNVAAFAGALQRGGYATDPNYAAKLTATAAAVQSLRASTQGAQLKVAAELPTTSGLDSA
jgi:peptidoglycan hydrolase FlgJ